MMTEKNRVLAVFPVENVIGGCEIYRCTQPLYYLGLHGWVTGWTSMANMYQMFDRDTDEWLEFVDRFDLFIFPRFALFDERFEIGFGAMFEIMRQMGKRIIYEVDDDYTNQHRQVSEGDMETMAGWTDAITVTTSYLASLMSKRTHRPTHILPNCVDPTLWRDTPAPGRQPGSEDKIIIGLTGSPTHYQDWKVLAPIMKPFMEANPNVSLLLMGFHPDYLDDVPNVMKFPGLTYPRYSQIIKGCDIILCPVDKQDGFNLGKSPIKATEGQAASRILPNGQMAGAAVIATDNPIYSLAIKHMKTGLLVDQTPEAWKDALQLLVDRRDLMTEIQVKGFNEVYKRYDASREWTKWAQAYRKVLNSPQNSINTVTSLSA